MIYYPEQHTIMEEIVTLSSSEKILAIEGSALHTLLFMKELKSEIMIIPRPKREPSPNFQTIANRKSFRQVYIPENDLFDNFEFIEKGHIRYRAASNIDQVLKFVNAHDWPPHYILSAHAYDERQNETDQKHA